MSIKAVSNAFTVWSAPSITITAPTAGEALRLNDVYSIYWTTTGDIQFVNIEYSPDQVNWFVVTSNLSNSKKVYDWTVPNIYSAIGVWVRITDSKNSTTFGISGSFSVLLDPFTIYAPSLRDTLIVGQQYLIKWVVPAPDPNVPNIYLKVSYSIDGGETWVIINKGADSESFIQVSGPEVAKDTLLMSGSHAWTPSIMVSTQNVRVRIEPRDQTSADAVYNYFKKGFSSDDPKNNFVGSFSDPFTVINTSTKESDLASIHFGDDFINTQKSNFDGGAALNQKLSDILSSLTPPPPPPPGGTWANIIGVNVGLSQGTVDTMDKAVKKLQEFTKILKTIGEILKLYMSTVNLVYMIILALIEAAHSIIKDTIKSWLDSGVYSIMLPEHWKSEFLKKDITNKLKLSPEVLAKNKPNDTMDGGFQGFLNRLEFALFNTGDKSRPRLDYPDSIVGGLILIIDTGNFFTVLKNLSIIRELFGFPSGDFMPIPPENIRGTYGYWTTDGKPGTKENDKFGVKLTWDPSVSAVSSLYLPLAYRIKRSKQSGGLVTYYNFPQNEFIPNSPVVDKIEYKDGDEIKSTDPEYFGGPKVVVGSNPPWGDIDLFYVDFNVLTPEQAGGNPQTYYYIIQASGLSPAETLLDPSKDYVINFKPLVFGSQVITRSYIRMLPLWGTASSEVPVTPISSIPKDALLYIAHQTGVETLTSSWGKSKLGSWRYKALFSPDDIKVSKLMGAIDNIFEKMKTYFSDFNKGVSEYLKMLMDKVDSLVGVVNLIIMVIQILQALKLDPSVKALWVEPALGGTRGFMDRVRAAKNAPTSGTPDYTVGMVFLIGSGVIPGGGQTTAAASKAMKALLKMIGLG